jgi:cytochrome c-type biogenesis protein CcmH/NrfG/chaperonin cofactor prefoldin
MRLQFFAATLLSLVTILGALGQSPDDRYLKIYSLLEEADKLGTRGDLRQAVPKYLEAQVAVKELQSSHPEWNTKLLNYRLDYISTRLDALTKNRSTNAPASAQQNTTLSQTSQFQPLQDEIARLAAQNALLDAKLREALSVQPAAADPKELAKAEERIKALQKERDLLAVTLEQASARQASGAPKDAGTEARRELATQNAVVSVLQKQNEDLQKQITELNSKLKKNRGGDDNREVAALRETVAELEARNRIMRDEQTSMENRLMDFVRRHGNASVKEKELEGQLAAAKAATATAERQRDELIDKLNRVTKELNQQTNSLSAGRIQELEQQMEAIRARLNIFEAKAEPYTAEELALFKQSPAKVASGQTNAPVAGKSESLTPEASSLMADALRAIDAGRLDEAERRYQEALRKSPNNNRVLANIAAVQLDQDKNAEAENTLKQALANDPNDPNGLRLLGDLKLRQDKNAEALEALSLSSKLAPEVPQTHYLLGKALIQNGDRGPAETSLRKAVQLKPGWGEAHYLLAVLYAAQQPGYRELAQYHYRKAIAGGAARNLELEQLMERRATPAKP